MRITPVIPGNTFKGIETGKTDSKFSSPHIVYAHDKHGMPVQYTTEFETVWHNYYELVDETPEEIKNFKNKYDTTYKFFFADKSQNLEHMRKHDWKCMGILPIKVSEWAQYLSDKAAMKAEDVFFIERVLERFNLKHLIKK